MVKKATAKKPMMQKGGVKKPLRKAQTGTSTGTPFQQYMKTPGAVASDTVMRTMYPGSNWDEPKTPIAKNPKNQGTLEKAYEKTYGQNWRIESGQPSSDETFEQYKRRMGPMKKGGATKTKKVVKPMMKAGGSTAGKTTPLYSNDPRTSQGRMVKKGGVAKTTYKKGGTTKKAVSAGMKKGGTVKRKK